MLEHAPLEVVYIYFDTATYDEIERDEKVTKNLSFQTFDFALLMGSLYKAESNILKNLTGKVTKDVI